MTSKGHMTVYGKTISYEFYPMTNSMEVTIKDQINETVLQRKMFECIKDEIIADKAFNLYVDSLTDRGKDYFLDRLGMTKRDNGMYIYIKNDMTK